MLALRPGFGALLVSVDQPIGYAAHIETAANSGTARPGDHWDWYERTAKDVGADAPGAGARENSPCAGCHSAAGTDAAHTPSVAGRDLVSTAMP